ncbi:MAG: GNAT family N-acetyltransferase, partial [Alphaproteobacteria bacterium]
LAQAGEARALGALCVRSKAHWGYDAEFMQLSHRSLQIDPAAIDAGRVFVATDEDDEPLGVADCSALPEPGAFDLLHLFVDPQALRRGVGRALFEAACTWFIYASCRPQTIGSVARPVFLTFIDDRRHSRPHRSPAPGAVACALICRIRKGRYGM